MFHMLRNQTIRWNCWNKLVHESWTVIVALIRYRFKSHYAPLCLGCFGKWFTFMIISSLHLLTLFANVLMCGTI